MSEKKVYIGTLYVGENEIEECKESVKKQTHPNITHEIFTYLPNKEAHDTLYSRFMELQGEYDYFIKLDADMVFKRDTIVEELIEIFEKNPSLDHAVFPLYDYYTCKPLMGLHMFSKRVKWSISAESLFVDSDPQRPGEKKSFKETMKTVALHSPNPSLEEAFMFGFHRALKVVQRNREIKNISQSKNQLHTLQYVWEAFINDKSLKRAAAVYGANVCFQNSEIILLTRKYDYMQSYISKLNKMNLNTFLDQNKKYWNRYSLSFYVKKIKYIYFFYIKNKVNL